METTEIFTGTLVHMECGECHCYFGLSRSHYDKAKNDGAGWFCPNGHERVFCEKETDKLRREVQRERARADQMEAIAKEARDKANHHQRIAVAHKGVATRIKNRIKKGVCPHCNRYFANLHRHMESKHTPSPPREAER